MKNEPTAQNFDDFSKICNRLRLIRSVFYGDDNYKFAEALGIHHSNASKLINGVSEPSHKTLSNLIAHTPNLSPDWAVSGVGSIYRGNITIESNSGNVAGVNNGTQTANANFADVVASQQRTIEQLTATNAKLTDLLASR